MTFGFRWQDPNAENIIYSEMQGAEKFMPI
jgi:hypothetical protein